MEATMAEEKAGRQEGGQRRLRNGGALSLRPRPRVSLSWRKSTGLPGTACVRGSGSKSGPTGNGTRAADICILHLCCTVLTPAVKAWQCSGLDCNKAAHGPIFRFLSAIAAFTAGQFYYGRVQWFLADRELWEGLLLTAVRFHPAKGTQRVTLSLLGT